MKVGVAAIFVGSTESFCFGGKWSNWSNCEREDGSQCGVGVRKRSKVCGFGSSSEEETDPCEKGMHAWSEWSNCCSESDRKENIRLRNRGSNCGVEVIDYDLQICTWIPFNPSRPRHPCDDYRNGQRQSGRLNGQFVNNGFEAKKISDRNYDNDENDRPWYASRYGFQIKNLLDNLFGDYSSGENNEEMSDENQKEVVAEIVEQLFDIYKN